MNLKKLFKWVVAVLCLVLLCSGIGTYFYINDYYHAGDDAIAIVSSENSSDVSDQIVFAPEHPKAGLIFYPGGKVQYESYAPILEALAKEDILCVLVHMPGNLAVLDINAADGIMEKYPDLTNWYLAGHSLGGSMAASYISKHSEEYAGLILLASYSTEDLSASGLDIISIFGTEDQVLNQESYKKYKSNLPSDFNEVTIEGGCHAFFGDYGPQNGDGTPTISRNEQTTQTCDAIVHFIFDRQ